MPALVGVLSVPLLPGGRCRKRHEYDSAPPSGSAAVAVSATGPSATSRSGPAETVGRPLRVVITTVSVALRPPVSVAVSWTT